MIRAKFKCSTIEVFEGGETVKLNAVSDKEGTNATWSKWTPSGSLTMTINNPDALGRFTPGKEYFLDFTEASADG